jgi:hypothetical protein
MFLDLLADADPTVRRAAPEALLVCRAEAARMVGALQRRLPVETDAEARAALVEAAGTLGRHAGAGRLPGVDADVVGTGSGLDLSAVAVECRQGHGDRSSSRDGAGAERGSIGGRAWLWLDRGGCIR